MSRRILNSSSLFLFSAVLFVFVFSTPAIAEKIQLSYANFPPAPTFPCVQMERWKTEVEKRTNGQVSVKTFPGGTLVGAKDMMDGVIAGVADIGCVCMAYQPTRFIVTNATSLPLGIPDSRTGSMVLLDLYKKYQPQAFKDVKVLAMFTTAPTNLMSKAPVKTLENMNGLYLRASGGAAQILKAWGANPIQLPMPSTVEALQKGIVSGLYSSLEVMKDFKFAESCKYVTMTDTVIYPFSVIMNMAKWNGLPDDVKKVFEDLIPEQSEWTGNYMDDHVQKAIAWSKEANNVEFIKLSADETTKWNSKLSFLNEKWVAGAKEKGLPAQAILDDIKTLVQKHKK